MPFSKTQKRRLGVQSSSQGGKSPLRALSPSPAALHPTSPKAATLSASSVSPAPHKLRIEAIPLQRNPWEHQDSRNKVGNNTRITARNLWRATNSSVGGNRAQIIPRLTSWWHLGSVFWDQSPVFSTIQTEASFPHPTKLHPPSIVSPQPQLHLQIPARCLPWQPRWEVFWGLGGFLGAGRFSGGWESPPHCLAHPGMSRQAQEPELESWKRDK